MVKCTPVPDIQQPRRLNGQRSSSSYLQNRSQPALPEYMYYGIQDSFYSYALKEDRKTVSSCSSLLQTDDIHSTTTPWLRRFGLTHLKNSQDVHLGIFALDPIFLRALLCKQAQPGQCPATAATHYSFCLTLENATHKNRWYCGLYRSDDWPLACCDHLIITVISDVLVTYSLFYLPCYLILQPK